MRVHMSPFNKLQRGARRVMPLALGAAMLAFAAGVTEAKSDTLVIGTVGKDTKAEMKEYGGLAKYLERELAPSGVDKVEVAVMTTAAKMSEALKDGSVHLYFESPLVAAKVGADSGAVPMLRRWRKGVAEYWGEILVLNESPIRAVEDLRGRVIAFEDPDSTTGHLLQRVLLREKGLDIEILPRPSDPISPTKVGAVFTNSDKASILQLFNGRVAAIATDSEYAKSIEAERPGSIRSIGRSITVPRHVAIRAAAMSETRAQRIAEVLKAMSQSDEGQKVLAAFGKTDRLDAFPDGIEATFAPIHARLRLLAADESLALQTQ